MVLVDPLANALKAITNAERRGKRQVLLRPASRVIIKFLALMQKHGYIGEFEIVDDHRACKVVVNLLGRLNKSGVICPRFDVTLLELEGWCNKLLPSRQFGCLVLTTSYGIMTHEDARKAHTGGKVCLLQYFVAQFSRTTFQCLDGVQPRRIMILLPQLLTLVVLSSLASSTKVRVKIEIKQAIPINPRPLLARGGGLEAWWTLFASRGGSDPAIYRSTRPPRK